MVVAARVKLDLSIGGLGETVAARVFALTVQSTLAEACLRDVARLWRFTATALESDRETALGAIARCLVVTGTSASVSSRIPIPGECSLIASSIRLATNTASFLGTVTPCSVIPMLKTGSISVVELTAVGCLTEAVMLKALAGRVIEPDSLYGCCKAMPIESLGTIKLTSLLWPNG